MRSNFRYLKWINNQKGILAILVCHIWNSALVSIWMHSKRQLKYSIQTNSHTHVRCMFTVWCITTNKIEKKLLFNEIRFIIMWFCIENSHYLHREYHWFIIVKMKNGHHWFECFSVAAVTAYRFQFLSVWFFGAWVGFCMITVRFGFDSLHLLSHQFVFARKQ